MNPDRPHPLFTPLRLGALHLEHRIFLSGSPPFGRAGAALQCRYALTEYYSARSSQGGLVLCSVTLLRPGSTSGAALVTGIHSAEQVNGWRAITQAIQARGGIAVAAICMPAEKHAIPDLDQVDDALRCYREASENASDAGFDGIELVATRGSLPQQLLVRNAGIDHPGTDWPGADFTAAALQSASGAWPSGRIGLSLGVPRTSTDFHMAANLVQPLQDLDLAYVHLRASRGRPGVEDVVARHVRPHPSCGLIVSGSWSPITAVAAVRRGYIDAIGPASGISAMHNLVERWQLDLETAS